MEDLLNSYPNLCMILSKLSHHFSNTRKASIGRKWPNTCWFYPCKVDGIDNTRIPNKLRCDVLQWNKKRHQFERLSRWLANFASIKHKHCFNTWFNTSSELCNSTHVNFHSFCHNLNWHLSLLLVIFVLLFNSLWQLSRLEIRLNTFRWSTIPQKQFMANSKNKD